MKNNHIITSAVNSNDNLAQRIKLIGIIALFLWISFFASFAVEIWQYLSFCLLVFLLLILLIWNKKSYKLLFDKAEIYFCLFLLSIAGGIVTVKEPAVAWRHFWHFIFPVPFVYLFAKITFQEKYGLLIIRALCFIASIICIYGIIEFLIKQNFIYERFVNNIYYKVFIGRRMMSTYIHPAPLATYFVAIFPFMLTLAMKEKSAFLKPLAVIYAVIISLGIILTFSRGGLLAAFVCLCILMPRLIKQKKYQSFFILFLLFIAIICISSLFSNIQAAFFRYSIKGLSQPFNYSSKIERFIALTKILKEHPFFGIGFGHFRVLFDYYLPHFAGICSYDGKIADCMYITILAETGIVGFSGFILFIFFLVKRAWIKFKLIREEENKLLILNFLAGFIGIMCVFLTYDALYWRAPNYLFWTYAGILSYLGTQKQIEKKTIG